MPHSRDATRGDGTRRAELRRGRSGTRCDHRAIGADARSPTLRHAIRPHFSNIRVASLSHDDSSVADACAQTITGRDDTGWPRRVRVSCPRLRRAHDSALGKMADSRAVHLPPSAVAFPNENWSRDSPSPEEPKRREREVITGTLRLLGNTNIVSERFWKRNVSVR